MPPTNDDNEDPKGGSEDAGKSPTPTPANDQLQGLLARHNNDWAAVAGQLFRDNYELRESRRQARAELQEARKKVPEGAAVLTGDELKSWEAYKALGEPDKVSGQLAELSTLRRDAQVAELASAHKLKASAVKRLLTADAQITVTGEGDKREFTIKVGDKESSVKDLLEGDWKEFEPALRESPAGSGGRKVLGQAGVEAGGDATDIVGSYINAQNQGPQPPKAAGS